MIAMEVGDTDEAEAVRPQGGASHLMLGPFPAVEEEELLGGLDGKGRGHALGGGFSSGSAKGYHTHDSADHRLEGAGEEAGDGVSVMDARDGPCQNGGDAEDGEGGEAFLVG